MREGASVGETWISREVVCFVIRSHGRRVRALPSGQLHCIRYGFLEESRIGGEDRDRNPIYEKGIRGGARTKCFE